jgi:molecular chaperone GrpE
MMNTTQDGEPVEALQAELARTRADAAELQQMLEQSQADFRNYKRRIESEREAERRQANRALILRLLPLLDDLRRALAERGAQSDAWTEGVGHILRKFDGVLAGEGLRRMQPVGERFDPNLHEAVAEVETHRVPEGHVAEISRDGYWLGDELLRPAQVVVARKPKLQIQRLEPDSARQPANHPYVQRGRPQPGRSEPDFYNLNDWFWGGKLWPR